MDITYVDFVPTDPGSCWSCGLSLWSAPAATCTVEHGSLAVDEALRFNAELFGMSIAARIDAISREDIVGWDMNAVYNSAHGVTSRQTFLPVGDLHAIPFLDALVTEDFTPARIRLYTNDLTPSLHMDIWATEDDEFPDALIYAPVALTA